MERSAKPRSRHFLTATAAARSPTIQEMPAHVIVTRLLDLKGSLPSCDVVQVVLSEVSRALNQSSLGRSS